MVSSRRDQPGSVSLAIQKKDLEQDLANLMVEYEVCADQVRTTVDPAINVKLTARKHQIFNQIQTIEQRLKDLERQTASPYRQTLTFDEALPNIDFRQARQVIDDVIKTLQLGEGGAALLLLQHSRKMAGDLLLSVLNDALRHGSTSPMCYDITFTPALGSADPPTFLTLLGGYLGVTLSDDQSANVATICDRLCNSLRDHSTIVIRITNWEIIGTQYQQGFMQWLLDSFWHPLVEQLCHVVDEWYARVIFVIVANRPLTADCRMLPCFCTIDTFKPGQILELPLENWTEADIRTWLIEHFRLPKHQVRALAEQIYAEAEGEPHLTRTALKDYFDQLLTAAME